jgi:tetratricopeptide (TPR) repeat protein
MAADTGLPLMEPIHHAEEKCACAHSCAAKSVFNLQGAARSIPPGNWIPSKGSPSEIGAFHVSPDVATARSLAVKREMLKELTDHPSCHEDTAALELEQGRFLKENGHPEEAEKCFRSALDHWKKAAESAPRGSKKRQRYVQVAFCWENLGQLSRCQGRGQQAEEHLRSRLALYQQLFDESPQDSELRRLLANSHNNLSWFLCIRPDRQPRHAALALEHAQKAVALEPMHHDWWHTLGVANCRLSRWKEALACIEKSRQLDHQGHKPGPPDAWERFFEAMAYHGLGDRDKARRCYEEAVDWMEKHLPTDLRRFRAEAAEILGIPQENRQNDSDETKRLK